MPSNAPQTLGGFNTGIARQAYSSTAWAAWQCSYYSEEIPVPPEFKHMSNKRRGESALDEAAGSRLTHKVPRCKQAMGLVWDAFYEIRTVAVLFSERELASLQDAERAELLAAVELAPCHADSARPRKWALTVLIRDVSLIKTEKAMRLLDAAAHIASFRSEDSDQLRDPAARDVRITVLTNRNAHRYAAAHSVGLREDEHVALILVRANEEGEVLARKEVLNATFASEKIAYCAIRTATATLFRNAGIADETPPSLFRASDVRSKDIMNAYEDSLQSTNDEFWGQLVNLDAVEGMDYKLCASHVHSYLKIAEKCVAHSPQGLTNQDVYFGALLHKKGQEKATEQFLMEVLTHEYMTEMMHFPNKTRDEVYVGLRYPVRDASERNLGLHIFEVQWEHHSLNDKLSSFGRMAVPGVAVCEKEHATVPRLVYKLRPFTLENYKNHYVLPCSGEQTLPLEECYADNMWKAFNIGLKMCWDRFCDKECVVIPPPRPLKAHKPSNEPAEEDQYLAAMGSVPMYGAFRVGDVLNNVSKCPVPAYKEFLVSGLRRLGPCTSMADLYKNCGELQDKVMALEASNRALEQALAEAQAEAARPVEPEPIRPSKKVPVSRAINGLNVNTRGGHILFKGADTEPLTFLYLIARSRGDTTDTPPSQEVMDEVPKRVEGLPDNVLVHLSAVVKYVQPNYFIVVIVAMPDGSSKFMLYVPENDQWEQVTLERALEPHGKPGTLYFQYFEEQRKLRPLVPQPRGQ